MRTKAKRPPLPVGTRLRYVNGSEFRRGDAPWVRRGDECVVIEAREGIDGHPELGSDMADPMDGWSVAIFHDDRRASIAIHHDWRERFERIGP